MKCTEDVFICYRKEPPPDGLRNANQIVLRPAAHLRVYPEGRVGSRPGLQPHGPELAASHQHYLTSIFTANALIDTRFHFLLFAFSQV